MMLLVDSLIMFTHWIVSSGSRSLKRAVVAFQGIMCKLRVNDATSLSAQSPPEIWNIASLADRRRVLIIASKNLLAQNPCSFYDVAGLRQNPKNVAILGVFQPAENLPALPILLTPLSNLRVPTRKGH